MQGEIYINENSVHYKFKSKYLRFKEDINNLINKIYVIQVYILKISTALFFQVTKEHTGNFADSSVGKESTCNVGDPDSIPGSGRSAGEGTGYSLQYSALENSNSPWVCNESDTTE